ncbi:lysophospholipase, partial [Streptomyces sp. TRM76130]|nr:lysophospholipase [Streptomyces sp. TRM76130]
LPLAVRAAQGRTGLDAARAVDHDGLDVPTLVFHGPADSVAPWQPSRRFADAHPRLVILHTVPHASHGAMWNAAPDSYEKTLRRFLTPLM